MLEQPGKSDSAIVCSLQCLLCYLGTNPLGIPPIVGGIIATYSFLSKDAPEYRNGYIICISFTCLAAAACIVYFLGIWHANHQRDLNATVSNPEATMSGHLAEEEDETEGLGDLAPNYRYIY